MSDVKRKYSSTQSIFREGNSAGVYCKAKTTDMIYCAKQPSQTQWRDGNVMVIGLAIYLDRFRNGSKEIECKTDVG